MNKKRLFMILGICGILAAAFILGATGAIDLSKENGMKPADRLIGVLITKKFPTSGITYIPSQGVVFSGRVQGVPAEKDDSDQSKKYKIPAEYDYIFPDNEGVRLFNVDEYFEYDDFTHRQINTQAADEVVSNIGTSLDIHDKSDNNGETVSSKTYGINGTIYYVLQDEEETFFASSIYQNADGEIYMVPSNSGTILTRAQMRWSGPTEFKKSSTDTYKENGKDITEGRNINVKIQLVHEPVKITLCQFNAAHELLQADEYNPEDIPRKITLLPEASLLLVDTENKPVDGEGSHTYDSYNREATHFNTLQYVDNGYCKANYHDLRWPDPDVARDLSWKVENETLTISGNGRMPNYELLWDEASPWRDEKFSRVIVEEGITSIGNYAFESFSSLTEISIPDSVTCIGEYAFRNCSQLKEITLPDSITSVRAFAFDSCSSLEYINLPASVQRIGTDPFMLCDNLKSITVSEGSYAEKYCKSHFLPYTY